MTTLLMVAGGLCRAQSAAAPFSVDGFATLGLARTNTDAAQFVRFTQSEGTTDRLDTDLDSVLGLQASYRFTPDWSATAQVLVRRNVNERYGPRVAAAFLRHQFSDALTVRLGRVAAPGFMNSEVQNVGYSNVMLRPPAELYSQIGVEHLDGVDLNYQRNVGASTITAGLNLGASRFDTVGSNGGGDRIPLTVRAVTMSLQVERGAWLWRAAHVESRVTIPDLPALVQLRGGLTQAGFGAVAADLTLADGKRVAVNTLGLSYDDGRALVAGEYGSRRGVQASYLPNTQAWYLLAGHRYGDLMPYVSHARLRQVGNSITLPANFPTSGGWSDAVRDGLLMGPEQHSTALGVRWNLAPSRALRVQVDQVRPTAKNGTLLGGPGAGLQAPVLVYAVALDLVF